MRTLLLLDSLFDNMPVRANNLEATKQLIVNNINNNYPTFRNLPVYIANKLLLGYDHDPDIDLSGSIGQLSIDDTVDFYNRQVKNQPRAFFIVGNKRMLNMEVLRRMGQVVELKPKDICR